MSSIINSDEKNDLANLFPTPKLFTSLDCPHSIALPGITPESTTVLRESLQDNHKRWHCFFEAELGFHNHATHGILALWSLGADAEVLKSAYAEECSYLRPTFTSPGPIDKNNWTEHLGEEKYYDAYLAFFRAELAARGPIDVVEHYVFSNAANHPEEGKPVEMLNRLLEVLFHPLIHIGYGYEFGLPGMIVEGLASTAVHGASSTPVIPPAWWKAGAEDTADTIPNTSLFNVLARIIGDPEIIPKRHDNLLTAYFINLEAYASKILKQVNSWKVDFSTKEGLRKCLEEIAWFTTIMYAIPGYTDKDQDIYKADFFYMHMVTSSMFLPCVMAQLKPKSRELLAKSLVACCLGWYIWGGKPDLNIEAFFADTKTTKSLISTQTSPPAAVSHNGLDKRSAISPNPWTEIIHLTLLHPDDHVPKLQRTLFHFARLYGTREAGYFEKDKIELKGAEKIDGSLFVRAANLTASRMIRGELCVMFVGKKDFWYRDGFYKK